MLPFLRASVPRTNTASKNPLEYEDGAASCKFHTSADAYAMTHIIPAGNVEPKTQKRTLAVPPLHYHMYQTEDFEVLSGAGRFFVDGAEIVVDKGGHAHVPIGAYHRFENAKADEQLVLGVRLDEQNWHAEESFFRNFLSYLDDCRKAGKEPSLFQLMLILYHFDCPVVVPVPVTGKQVSWLFMALTGVVIGQWMLGYKASYPEYYNSQRTQTMYGTISKKD